MPDFQDLWRFIRIRHPYGLAIGLVSLSALIVIMGRQAITLPAANGRGSTELAYHSFAPLGIAALAGGCLVSSMATQEQAGARNLFRAERRYLFTMSVFIVLLVGVAEAVSVSVPSAVVHIRSLLIWYGLALLSGRVFGRAQAWILPLATLFPLEFLGQDRFDRPRWWNWLDYPAGSLTAWAMAATAIAVGVVAVVSTPWRLHELTWRLTRAER